MKEFDPNSWEYSQHLKKQIANSLSEINELRDKKDAFSPEFKRWKNRTLEILMKHLDRNSCYYKEFSELQFWDTRLRAEEENWSEEDQVQFEKDLDSAKLILNDALDNWNNDARVNSRKMQTENNKSDINIVINNILAANISVTHIKDSARKLNLNDEDREKVKKLIIEFEKESNIEGNWIKLGRIIEKLKNISRTAYREIAVPLIIEYISRIGQ
jgi:hypothetical protein